MNQSELIQLAFNLFNTIILVFTLVYAIKQFRAGLKSLEETQKSTNASTISTLTNSINQMQFMLLEHEDLAKKIGYSKEDIFAFIMIDTFEEKFLLHKQGLIKGSSWEANKILIRDFINRDFILNIWQRRQQVYGEEFKDLVNSLIEKNYKQTNKPLGD